MNKLNYSVYILYYFLINNILSLIVILYTLRYYCLFNLDQKLFTSYTTYNIIRDALELKTSTLIHSTSKFRKKKKTSMYVILIIFIFCWRYYIFFQFLLCLITLYIFKYIFRPTRTQCYIYRNYMKCSKLIYPYSIFTQNLCGSHYRRITTTFSRHNYREIT